MLRNFSASISSNIFGVLSLLSFTPIFWMLVFLAFSLKPLRLSFFFFFFFYIYSVLLQWFPPFCLPGHLSICLCQLFFYWFLIVCCYLFLCSLVLLDFGKHFLHLLHSFSETLDHLNYYYCNDNTIWKVAYVHFIYLFFWDFVLSLHLDNIFCLFILIFNSLWLWFLFLRLLDYSPSLYIWLPSGRRG